MSIPNTLKTSRKGHWPILLFTLCVLILGVWVGSAPVPLGEILRILASKLPGITLDQEVALLNETIIWRLRLPRVLLAFFVGGGLAISGAAVQSTLKNPLASPFTLGVSSGAALGVSLFTLAGAKMGILGILTMPLVGFALGMGTILLVLAFARRVDRQLSSRTVILAGMVISLFVNALLTLVMALFRESVESIVFWQMGSLALRGWPYVGAILPFFLVGITGLFFHARILDILSVGDESATALGIEVPRVKLRILFFASLLTGSAVAMTGTIGFIGLVAPHVVRRFTGPAHGRVLPLSMAMGGSFLVLADLVARTLLSPSELPVGAITALIGAPFFAMVFFSKNKTE